MQVNVRFMIINENLNTKTQWLMTRQHIERVASAQVACVRV